MGASATPGPGMLRLAGGAAEVDVVPAAGGALAGFRLAARDVLRPTPPSAIVSGSVREFACYPLVPFSNRIRDGLLTLAGGERHQLAPNFGEHPHTIHGVGWQRPWQVLREGASDLTLSLEHRAEGADALAWPFPFRATQAFTLRAGDRDATLTLSLAIANVGTRAFPFGLGWHPFFPRAPGSQLRFQAGGVWKTDDTQIPTDWVPLDAQGERAFRFDGFRPLDDVALDHVYTGWNGRATIATGGLRIDILADRALDHLVVYVPPGRDFLAVEPVTHMTDAFNRDARRQSRTGTRHLAPGASWCGTMRIVATLSPPP